MRLISQDGMVDMPYERTTLQVDEGNIFAYADGLKWHMGHYSDEDTAMHEIGLMRLAYARGDGGRVRKWRSW